MNKLTPEIIESATDEQLSELVAVHCMGWHPAEVWKDGKVVHTTFTGEFTPTEPGQYSWRYRDLARLKNWQPHQDTPKGNDQSWKLVLMYKLWISIGDDKWIVSGGTHINDYIVEHENPNIAVLKACLYSVIGDE